MRRSADITHARSGRTVAASPTRQSQTSKILLLRVNLLHDNALQRNPVFSHRCRVRPRCLSLEWARNSPFKPRTRHEDNMDKQDTGVPEVTDVVNGVTDAELPARQE